MLLKRITRGDSAVTQWHQPANYDDLLDEPDEELCDEHSRPRPCMVCLVEHWEARAEAMREEGR